MSYLEKILAKYPKVKKTKHSGDSYVIYESGKRDLEDPFGTKQFEETVEEDEGKQAKAANPYFDGRETYPSSEDAKHKYDLQMGGMSESVEKGVQFKTYDDEADGYSSFETSISLLTDFTTDLAPLDDSGGYPDQRTFTKKVFSETELDLSLIRPTADEILAVARLFSKDDPRREQLERLASN